MSSHHPGSMTSLWALIETMQERLEAEGLDDHVVDRAVAQGLQAILRSKRRRRSILVYA